MRLFVCNFPYETTAQDLKEWFGQYGKVVDTVVIWDRESDHSRGFGFVEMKDRESGQSAIAALNGDFRGPEDNRRRLKVKEANPQKPRRGRAPVEARP